MGWLCLRVLRSLWSRWLWMLLMLCVCLGFCFRYFFCRVELWYGVMICRKLV